jgi:hypothetical protein
LGHLDTSSSSPFHACRSNTMTTRGMTMMAMGATMRHTTETGLHGCLSLTDFCHCSWGAACVDWGHTHPWDCTTYDDPGGNHNPTPSPAQSCQPITISCKGPIPYRHSISPSLLVPWPSLLPLLPLFSFLCTHVHHAPLLFFLPYLFSNLTFLLFFTIWACSASSSYR